jgi:hypothetical protein
MKPLQDAIIRTLLYYDIWAHPLTFREILRFLPVRVDSPMQVKQALDAVCTEGLVHEEDGHYFLQGKSAAIVSQRLAKEAYARYLWILARISTHVIRRFPFVRAIFVSGDLSKNVASRTSDVDFFIIAEPGRLWIARTLLILFKKIFLLNRKKFFCLNSFVAANTLSLDEQNIFLATEIATLKPLWNGDLFRRYLEANDWILSYFPNFTLSDRDLPRVHNRGSIVQKLFELPFRWLPAESMDTWLLGMMERTWKKRYPEFDDETRRRIFRCTKGESRAYAGNFQEKILALYTQRLRAFEVEA